eukprot:TRINITY_DN1411_c0_g1_i1.p1 TRINITY_DN1411_c0_g1~~TRINITY_DN1411_c0_g1_i1.p1  ORF type:complete len:150 (+),score=9.16 TRINITY_DN1411_c0_g1_i1:184-633(+)
MCIRDRHSPIALITLTIFSLLNPQVQKVMCFSRTLLLHKNDRQTTFASFMMIASNHLIRTMPIVLIRFFFCKILSVEVFYTIICYYLAVSYTHLRAHETSLHLVCRLLLEKKKKKYINITRIAAIQTHINNQIPPLPIKKDERQNDLAQ